jgi:hypothetical protein
MEELLHEYRLVLHISVDHQNQKVYNVRFGSNKLNSPNRQMV